MTPQIVIAIVAIVVTVLIAIISHIVVSVWWASRITTTLSFLKTSIEKMEKHQDGYYTKEEAVKELALADQQHKALWLRVDEQRTRIESLEKEIAFIKDGQ